MAVFGVDLGNLYSSVSVARKRGIDVIMNEVSKRETNTYVSFGGAKDGRMIGEKGADMKVRNFRNTVNHLKRLVGVKFDSDEWRTEQNFSLFRAVEGKDGFIEVEVDFEDETKLMKPEQLVAMMLSKLGSYVDREAALDAGKAQTSRVVDCVVACPPYYSAFQRKRLLQAADIAGLNCLTLVTEGTAVALSYGIFRSNDLPEKEEDGQVVQFCDMGHSCTYITTAKLWKGNLKVLGHEYDRNLGCRDFDMALASYFRGEIETKYKMDVFEQKKAKLRLLAGCEKLRYTLSANPVVSLNVECIMNDVDISFSNYQRDHFEEITAPLWARMEQLVKRATANVDVEKVHAVEVVGGGSYMPKVKGMLADAFGRSVSTTLNVSEAVAKGCGIIGAILSPRFHVKDFLIQDAVTSDIMIGYHSKESTAPSPVDFTDAINKETSLYAKNCGFPKVFDLSFDRKEDFDLYTYYKEDEAIKSQNGSMLIGHWTFKNLPPFKDAKGTVEEDKKVRVAVRFQLNASGVINVQSATVSEKYEVEEKVLKPVDNTPKPAPSLKDVGKPKKTDEELEAEKWEIVTKEKTRKIDVEIVHVKTHGIPVAECAALKKEEARMAAADRLINETMDAKNAVEGYSYEYRSKAEEGGELFAYMSEDVRNAFKKACDEAADWVYGDGDEATKDVYVKKLAELRRPGDAAQARRKLREEIPLVFQTAEAEILKTTDEAQRLLGTAEWIDQSKLEEVQKKAQECRDVMKKDKTVLESTPQHADVLVNPALLTNKVTELTAFARPIFNTPKPAPKEEEKTEEKPASPKADEKTELNGAGMDVDE